MSVVRNAAKTHDLVRLMADEGAELPEAAPPRRVESWSTWADMMASGLFDANDVRYAEAAQAWARQVQQMPVVQIPAPVAVWNTQEHAGNLTAYPGLGRVERQQARAQSFGAPYSLGRVAQQIPRAPTDLRERYQMLDYQREVVGWTRRTPRR